MFFLSSREEDGLLPLRVDSETSDIEAEQRLNLRLDGEAGRDEIAEVDIIGYIAARFVFNYYNRSFKLYSNSPVPITPIIFRVT